TLKPFDAPIAAAIRPRLIVLARDELARLHRERSVDEVETAAEHIGVISNVASPASPTRTTVACCHEIHELNLIPRIPRTPPSPYRPPRAEPCVRLPAIQLSNARSVPRANTPGVPPSGTAAKLP